MNILWIALKNVVNAKRRSLFTFAILSFGAMLYIATTLLMDSLLNLAINETVKEETAHIRIQSPDYDDERPLSSTNMWIFDASMLKNIEGITHTSRLFMEAEIDNYQDSLPVVFLGIDPETDPDVFTMPLKSSSELEEGITWIGANLAESLKVQEGDYVNLTFRNPDGVFISAEYEVGSLLTSANPQFTDMGVVVSIHELQSLIETNMITYHSIKVDDISQIKMIQETITDFYPNQMIKNKDDLLSQTIASLNQRKQFMNIYILMILVITLMGIVNSVFISVWEKRRLTGMLRAIGYSDKSMMMLFVYEGAWIGFFGAVIGVVISVLLNIPLTTIGWNIQRYLEIGGKKLDVGFYIPPVLKTHWDVWTFITPLIFIPIASMLVSLLPAYKSIKMSVIDCIRNSD